MDPFNFIASFGGGLLGYAVVLGLLLLCGLGVPVPEDIILIAGGYIAYEAGHPVWPMILCGLVGILGGDSIVFTLGRRFGVAMAERTFLRRFLTPDRLARVDGLFKAHGQKIIFAARYMPGVRSVTFFSSGAIGVPYWKFLVFDGLAALVSAPLWVGLGFRYGHEVVAKAKHWQGYILGGLIVVIAGYVLWNRFVAKKREPVMAANDAEAELPAASLDEKHAANESR